MARCYIKIEGQEKIPKTYQQRSEIKVIEDVSLCKF